MNQKKISSKLHILLKAAAVAVLVAIMSVYLVVAKPGYGAITGLGHFFTPIATGFGNFITWPVRAIGKVASRIHEISVLESENEELRAKLDFALSTQNKCDIAILENQKLARELDIAGNSEYRAIVADVIYNNSVMHHDTFMINRGKNDGIEKNMVVVSFENALVGIIADVGSDFSKVRALTDSGTNIAVRIAGSEVYGFLQGNGSSVPVIGFFSDHKFQPSAGVKLVTSNISGVLPPDIFVGKMKTESDVDVTLASEISRVMVLKFNMVDKYK